MSNLNKVCLVIDLSASNDNDNFLNSFVPIIESMLRSHNKLKLFQIVTIIKDDQG